MTKIFVMTIDTTNAATTRALLLLFSWKRIFAISFHCLVFPSIITSSIVLMFALMI
jgi:hypothetical protein